MPAASLHREPDHRLFRHWSRDGARQRIVLSGESAERDQSATRAVAIFYTVPGGGSARCGGQGAGVGRGRHGHRVAVPAFQARWWPPRLNRHAAAIRFDTTLNRYIDLAFDACWQWCDAPGLTNSWRVRRHRRRGVLTMPRPCHAVLVLGKMLLVAHDRRPRRSCAATSDPASTSWRLHFSAYTMTARPRNRRPARRRPRQPRRPSRSMGSGPRISA